MIILFSFDTIDLMIKEIALDPPLLQKLFDQLDVFSQHHILLIGDLGLDEYLIGEVRRISPEAPVPVVEVESRDIRLGLAANVALNIKTLGGNVTTIGLIGDDSNGEQLKEICKQKRINTAGFVIDHQRKTTLKTRIMAHHHHIVRVDHETKQFLSPSALETTQKYILKHIHEVDAIIIQDYGKGMISPELVRFIIDEGKKAQKPVYVDPYRTNRAEFYSGCTLIKPNYQEAQALVGMDPDDIKKIPNRVELIGKTLLQRAQAEWVVVTQGKEGMTLFDRQQNMTRVPTFAKEVYDVTGAGDTVIATLSLGLAAHLSLEEASILANMAAGIVVAKSGCVPCEKEDLRQVLSSLIPR
ncbi:MAG: D-glycero-beta-D-manno-heptose-7-phosphate kinase [Bdellovibrionaceae bacterium]|nr:D-glycero-beta-D-manno-heptose-7-phosphate kinase [Pseudobdellovibrionaceae bacterium]MDW8189451.1 D-glycero-beta-D-manno-heptose-7-phosphate kinase [Pseudobdellovibrionaceae bacterium]